MARNDKGEPDKKGFPIITSVLPKEVPPIAGIDNAKFKVFEDYRGYQAKVEAATAAGTASPPGPPTTLEADLETLKKQKAENKPVEPKLEENLTKLMEWWVKEGRPNYEHDKGPLIEARLYGAKAALLYTAAVPLALAVGFMILIAYFFFTGGYKQVHLEEEPPMGEY
jgi:hypothetical protein